VFGDIDEDALVGSRANEFLIVPALDFEVKFTALYCNEFYLSHNIHANRRRGDVTHADVSTDGALTWCQMRAQGFDARPFDISNHESGRKDRWRVSVAAERLEYGRNDQRIVDNQCQGVTEAGLQTCPTHRSACTL
jgi:hypothetical protein